MGEQMNTPNLIAMGIIALFVVAIVLIIMIGIVRNRANHNQALVDAAKIPVSLLNLLEKWSENSTKSQPANAPGRFALQRQLQEEIDGLHAAQITK